MTERQFDSLVMLPQLDERVRGRLVTQEAESSNLERAIAEFCRRWQIAAFYLFGSVLRDDFGPDSDIDVMVSFQPAVQWGFEIVDIKKGLESLFNRNVDLITVASVERSENWIRQREIMQTARLVYVSR